MSGEDEAGWTCRVCLSPLTRQVTMGPEGMSDVWRHPPSVGGDGHRPVPVLSDQVQAVAAKMVCDVCSHPEPVWDVPTCSTTQEVRTDRGGLTIHDAGGWALCEACMALVEARWVPGLIGRALQGNPSLSGVRPGPEARRQIRSMLREAYVQFLATIDGPKRPLV